MSETQFDDLADQLDQSLTEFETSNRHRTLAEKLWTAVERLEATFESAETFGEVEATAEELWSLLDEGEDVLDSFETEAFLETVDVEELPNVIDSSDVPDAIESGDLRKALDLKALQKAINFREYWDSEEMQQLWNESQELSAAVDAMTGDDDDTDDEGIAEAADGEASEMAAAATEGKLQSELLDNVENFREKIDAARDQVQQQLEESELGSGGEQQSSDTSTTGFSTVPESRPDMDVRTGFSTMPKKE